MQNLSQVGRNDSEVHASRQSLPEIGPKLIISLALTAEQFAQVRYTSTRAEFVRVLPENLRPLINRADVVCLRVSYEGDEPSGEIAAEVASLAPEECALVQAAGARVADGRLRWPAESLEPRKRAGKAMASRVG